MKARPLALLRLLVRLLLLLQRWRMLLHVHNLPPVVHLHGHSWMHSLDKLLWLSLQLLLLWCLHVHNLPPAMHLHRHAVVHAGMRCLHQWDSGLHLHRHRSKMLLRLRKLWRLRRLLLPRWHVYPAASARHSNMLQFHAYAAPGYSWEIGGYCVLLGLRLLQDLRLLLRHPRRLDILNTMVCELLVHDLAIWLLHGNDPRLHYLGGGYCV